VIDSRGVEDEAVVGRVVPHGVHRVGRARQELQRDIWGAGRQARRDVREGFPVVGVFVESNEG
jgi:hypothetical protein